MLQKSRKSMPQANKYFLARKLGGKKEINCNGLIDSFHLWCRMKSRRAKLGEGLDKKSQGIFGGSPSYLK